MCILESLFEETEEGWSLPVLIGQIEQYQRNAQKNRENGKKGGRPRKSETQTEPSGFSAETQCEAKKSLTNNQEPITKNQIDKEINKEKPTRQKKTSAQKPDDISDSVWFDWVEHRKQKKASVSELVINGLRKEAEIAGLTLEEVMTIQVINGWQGFKASWLTKEGVKGIPTHTGELTQEQRKQQGYGYDW